MAVRYVIDKERRLVISTATDCLTFADATAHQQQLVNDPEFNPDFDQILDGTRVTSLDLSVDQTRTLARREMFSATSRRAFVASNTAIFGMARLFGIYHEMSKSPSNFRAFHDMSAALEWLGVKNLPK
jgi:hypothetical protein